MRKVYLLILVVIFTGMFQVNLISKVESQIKGVIVDDETGLHLSKAYIELIKKVNSILHTGNIKIQI
jgi:hypothetical protein